MSEPKNNNFDKMSLSQLDAWYDENMKQYEGDNGEIDFGQEPNAKFYALVEQYERYLEVRDKLLKRKPVKTAKEIIADSDAVATTLKTFYAINTKIQNQIEGGQPLETNDIKLLVDMMRVLNGDK